MPTTGPARPLPSPAQVQGLWRTLNSRYFADALSTIGIRWSPRLTSSAGLFVSLAGPRDADRSPDRRGIRLSIPLLGGQPARELMATLAHEMIHQWQYDVLKRRPDHGAGFLRKMQEFTRDGLPLTVRHHLDRRVDALGPFAWACTSCGEVYRRQRRSIRPRQHRCGRCNGPLREVPGHGPRPIPVVADTPPGAGPRAPGRLPQLTLPFA